jgi:hypothetical protein
MLEKVGNDIGALTNKVGTIVRQVGTDGPPTGTIGQIRCSSCISLLHSGPKRLETCDETDDVMSRYKDRVGHARGRGGAGPVWRRDG